MLAEKHRGHRKSKVRPPPAVISDDNDDEGDSFDVRSGPKAADQGSIKKNSISDENLLDTFM
jgi:hypothetical protein